jgi:hypothetical protein
LFYLTDSAVQEHVPSRHHSGCLPHLVLLLQDTGVLNVVDGTGAAIWASNAAVAPAGGGGGGGATGERVASQE